jgi:HSP90 family molecular chaperone
MTDEIVIGSRILDVLTTGMYPDALDAIREYIQNSFDAIRAAEYSQILKPNFGEVIINIDAEQRVVTIRDNGIGIRGSPRRRKSAPFDTIHYWMLS